MEPTTQPKPKPKLSRQERATLAFQWTRLLLPIAVALVGAIVAIVAPRWSPVVDAVEDAVQVLDGVPIVIPMEPADVPVCPDPDHDHAAPGDPDRPHDDDDSGALHVPPPIGDRLAAESGRAGGSAPRSGRFPASAARWRPPPGPEPLRGAQALRRTDDPRRQLALLTTPNPGGSGRLIATPTPLTGA